MSTLGLDLGANIGWVLGGAVGPMRAGTFKIPPTTNLGLWLASTDRFFQLILPQCTSIAVEQPFLGEDYYPARKLISLLGHVAYWSHFYGIGIPNEVPVSTGKLALSGFGGADAEKMIAAAVRWGLTDPDEHQAHALGIWKVHVFGKADPIRKARSRSGPVTIIKPGEGGANG